jgi:hypothetical protein
MTRDIYEAMPPADQRVWRTDYDAYVKPSGNLLSHPHIYLSIPLLFNELTPWLLLYIYFLTASATATAALGKG